MSLLHPQRKFGRKPRKFNPRIPHFSALFQRRQLAPPPISVDYTVGMGGDFGMMLNDSLGDCTCAAVYHARQVWSFNSAKKETTESDAEVLQLYEEACGYDPSNPDSDQGGNEQDVLTYLLKTGMPTSTGRDKISAFVEVDPRNLDDIKRTINDCGVAYIGVEVPQSVMDNADDPSKPWDVGGNTEVAGGHAVVLVSYDLDFFTCISWGQKYKITPAFFGQHLDEVYAIADDSWINATGKTPLGMSLLELEAQMQALKEA